MIKNHRSFQFICRLCAAFFILLVSSPLITLAFYTTEHTSTSTVAIPPVMTQPPPLAAQNIIEGAYYLGETIADLPPQNKIVYDLFTVSERKARNLPTALLDVDPYYGHKVVYLTFDDGPDANNTPIILAILKNYGIKATFFVVGTQAEKYPDLLKTIYQEGHAIGNHTYNHIYRELYQSVDSYTTQLHHNDDVIKNILGVRPRITRAPGGSSGSFSKAYWNRLKEEGYIEVDWNVSSGDASKANASQIVNTIIDQMKNDFLWNHAIVLMHDGIGHTETVKALPAIIRFYKERGFEFRTVNTYTPTAW